jgi:hypothetical protein
VTLSHDETNARLLELVYDEATPTERAALEAHVATCAQCQAELAALGETRAHLRVALDDAPVPARAHARILEAAAQAVATPPVQALVAAAPARAIVPARAPSPWERLRGRWTFPTLATVGAVAVVLLASKVFLDPQRTVERGREAMAPAEPQPATVTRSDEARAKNAAPPAGPADELGASDDRARAIAPVAPAFGGLMGKRMAGAFARKHRESANLLHGAASSEGAGEIVSGGLGAGSSGVARGEAQPAAPASAAPAGAFARPPSDWKGGAPGNGPAPASRGAPVASSAPRRLQKLSDDSLDGLGAAAPSESKAEPAPAKPLSAKKSERDEGTGADSPVADKEIAAARDPSDERDKKVAPAKDKAPEAKREEKAEAAPTQETLAHRAEQLFAARRWSAAIAAYRDLIRRFPDADLKPRWSARLTQAQAESDAAIAQRRAAAASEAQARAKASKKADVEPVGQ